MLNNTSLTEMSPFENWYVIFLRWLAVVTNAMALGYVGKNIEFKVDVYFAGHEHDIQYIKPDGVTHHLISGAGSEVRKTGLIEGISKFAASIQGFMAVTITKKEMLVQVIDYKGNIIYTTRIRKQV